MQFVPMSSATKGSAKVRLVNPGWVFDPSCLAARRLVRLLAGPLAAGWSGGSSGFQPGMRWPTGGGGTGAAVRSSAGGRVGAERPWNPSDQVATCAGSAGGAMWPDRRWTTSTTRLWPATAPRRREVTCRNCLSSEEGRAPDVFIREKTRSASDMRLQKKRVWPGGGDSDIETWRNRAVSYYNRDGPDR